MSAESLTKDYTSHNTRSVPYTGQINSVSNGDTGCAVCGGPLKRSAKRYCGLACYRIVQRSGDLAARFWSKVTKGADDQCWLWTAAVFGSLGYGQFSKGRVLRGGRMVPWPVYAHRVAWELTNGPIPENQQILHRCDVPRCCNPSHLFLGTHRLNMEDAARKGRLNVSHPARHKVTDAQVEQMRALVASGMKRVRVAEQFGVSKAFISQIMNGTRRKYPRPVDAMSARPKPRRTKAA